MWILSKCKDKGRRKLLEYFFEFLGRKLPLSTSQQSHWISWRESVFGNEGNDEDL